MPSTASPKKILAIKFRALGDSVLMSAPLLTLKARFPNAEIHIAVTAPWASLFERHPSVSRIWPYVRHDHRPARAKAVTRLGLALRKEKFDWVVNFHASPSSAILAFATGSKTRSVHFHGHRDRNKYSTVKIAGKGTVKPNIERDMDALRALGVECPVGSLPKLFLGAEEIELAQQRLLSQGLKAPLLTLGLGASRPTKIWPMEQFAHLAGGWIRDTGGSVLAIVGPGEDPLAAELFKHAPNHDRLHVLPHFPIRDVAAILSQSAVFVGNDSGPKHLAVALGCPTVSFFGPEHPLEWHPYPKDRHPYFFVEDLKCRRDALPGMPPWCALEVCTLEQHKCMRLVGWESALKECMRVAAL